MRKVISLAARRRLIAMLVIVAGLVVVSFLNNAGTVAQIGTTTTVVSIARTVDGSGNVDYSPDDAQVDAAVRQAVELAGGLPANVGPGKKIVIQPNMVEAGWMYYNPGDEGVCTHRQVVRTLVNMCLEAGATIDNIIICEGAAGFHNDQGGYDIRRATYKAFKDCGYDLDGNMYDDATGAKLVDANYAGEYNGGGVYPNYPGYSGPYDTNYVTQMVRSNYLISRAYYVPKCVAQCDVLIRVPVLKNHDLAGLTGGLKLAFGIGPSDIYHAYWLQNMKWNLLHQQSWGYNEIATNSRGMADMTLARPPDMVVVDGLVGITSGPTRIPNGYSSPAKASPYMACIIAGTDVVAVDTISALAIGYQVNTTSCPGIYMAYNRGLGTIQPGKIEVRGAHVKDIRRWFPAWGNGTPGEQTPPTLGGLNIPNNLHVGGQVVVVPTGYSDSGGSGLCKGELYIDGELVGSNDSSSSQYGVTWDSGTVAPGAHQLTYTLYDWMLNETSLTRTVYVESGSPIAAALDVADGTSVAVGPVYVTGTAPAIDANTFFVSSADGIRGLRVRYSSAPSVQVGQQVNLAGTMATTSGQRYLNCTSVSPVAAPLSPIKPRLFGNQALGGGDRSATVKGVNKGVGLNNVGCLVKCVGRVTAGGSDYFYIDDGSLATNYFGPKKLKVYSGSLGQPAAGSYVSVIGFSCTEDDGGNIERLLVLRSASDFQAL